jgi:hypothetical protein
MLARAQQATRRFQPKISDIGHRVFAQRNAPRLAQIKADACSRRRCDIGCGSALRSTHVSASGFKYEEGQLSGRRSAGADQLAISYPDDRAPGACNDAQRLNACALVLPTK